MKHLHGRWASCTPPRLVLRPHRSSSCLPSLWPGPLTLPTLIECQKQSCAQGDSCSRRKGAQEILASSSLRNKSPTEDLSEVVSLISAEDLFSRQGARKHQRKIGLLCGVSLVGTYQAYASHVFECPGEFLYSKPIKAIVSILFSDGEKAVRCPHSRSNEKDKQVLARIIFLFPDCMLCPD